MLSIKVWCLPSDLPEDHLRELHRHILDAVRAIPETKVENENDMVVLFPPDLMSYGLGEEILIEIEGQIFNEGSLGLAQRNDLARAVGVAVKENFSHSKVSCRVRKHDPADGEWSIN